MPTISAFHGIVISMWFNDHPTPHFHAKHAEYEMTMSIHKLELVSGKLPPKSLRLVRKWAFEHRAELLDNWNRARAHRSLKSIAPLP